MLSSFWKRQIQPWPASQTGLKPNSLPRFPVGQGLWQGRGLQPSNSFSAAPPGWCHIPVGHGDVLAVFHPNLNPSKVENTQRWFFKIFRVLRTARPACDLPYYTLYLAIIYFYVKQGSPFLQKFGNGNDGHIILSKRHGIARFFNGTAPDKNLEEIIAEFNWKMTEQVSGWQKQTPQRSRRWYRNSEPPSLHHLGCPSRPQSPW